MVRKIHLTHGQVAIVDNEEYAWLSQHKWQALWNKSIQSYYAYRMDYLGKIDGEYKRKGQLMHRAIMDAFEKEEVDHINHDTLDNRKENLRIVTHRQNNQNKKRKGSSKYPGVYWNKREKVWQTSISVNGKRHYLGRFKEERDAAKAYEKACRGLGEELVCKT